MTYIHSCSLYCERPECVKAQRDEMRDGIKRHEEMAAMASAEIADLTAELARLRAVEPWVRGVFKGADVLRAAVEYLERAAPPAQPDSRTCTCHPDDNPPVPCPKKYALSECRVAQPAEPAEPVQLTEVEIFKAYTTATGKVLPNMGSSRAELVAITRIIERAHGITGAKK